MSELKEKIQKKIDELISQGKDPDEATIEIISNEFGELDIEVTEFVKSLTDNE